MQRSESSSKVGKFYSVAWPENWETRDLTDFFNKWDREQNLSKEDPRIPGIVDAVGGAPKGHVVAYQHAILVSTATVVDIIKGIDKWEKNNNADFRSEHQKSVNGRTAIKRIYENRANRSNKFTYYIFSGKKWRVIVCIHGPGVSYLDVAGDELLNSLQLID